MCGKNRHVGGMVIVVGKTQHGLAILMLMQYLARVLSGPSLPIPSVAGSLFLISLSVREVMVKLSHW